MTAVEYQNKLESAFASLPGPLQSVLRPAFDPVDEALQWVCGDPDALLSAGQKYVSLGTEVTQSAERVRQDAAALRSSWTDNGGVAFQNKVRNTSQALQGGGSALQDTNKILTAGAHAAVDAANTICDIVVSVVEFIIADYVVAAALSAITFGASLAAATVGAIADMAQGAAQVSRVVAAIVKVLRAIEKVLKEIKALFATLKEIFLLLRELNKEVGFLGKGEILVAKTAISKITSGTFNSVPGVPSLPKGGVHWGIQAGEDAHSTYGDVQDAQDVDG